MGKMAARPKRTTRFVHDPAFRVPRLIKFGSDFAGYDTAMLAARRLKLPCASAFACENNRSCQKVLKSLGHSNIIGDVLTRDPSTTPYVDVFTFSPPCIDFSIEGKGMGEKQESGRLYVQSLKYIKAKKPRLVLYENVAALYERKAYRQTVRRLVGTLRSCGYNVYGRVLTTSAHGVPQSRRRFYLVSVLKAAQRKEFTWPKVVPLMYTMKDVIKPVCKGKDYAFALPGDTPATAGFTAKNRQRARLRVTEAIDVVKKKLKGAQ